MRNDKVIFRVRALRALALLYAAHPLPRDIDSEDVLEAGVDPPEVSADELDEDERRWLRSNVGLGTLVWLRERGFVRGDLEPFRLRDGALAPMTHAILHSVYADRGYLGDVIVEAVQRPPSEISRLAQLLEDSLFAR